MTTTNESLQYWKPENVYLVPTAQTGELEPALYFRTFDGLHKAMEELNVISHDDPLRETVHPATDEECHNLMMQCIDLALQRDPDADESCVLWIDRTRNPRVEWLGDRPITTFREGFWAGGWIMRKLAEDSKVCIKALRYIMAQRVPKKTAPTTTMVQTSALMPAKKADPTAPSASASKTDKGPQNGNLAPIDTVAKSVESEPDRKSTRLNSSHLA